MKEEEQLKLIKEWLSPYTDEVVIKVMKNLDKIINDETTMRLLKLLADQKADYEKNREWMMYHLVQDSSYYDEEKPFINKDYMGTQNVLYNLYIKG